jgi:chromate reductase, NAD(P)H dehydrogenase (quinone)
MHIVVICGTNRSGALSATLAHLYRHCYIEQGASVDLLSMAELPASALHGAAYRQPETEITRLVERFCAADGVHFVVPEYNGSFPGVLKLFIDMLPYPEGFDQRPCAFTGLAAGQFQGLRAVEHLQQIACYRNALQCHCRLFIGNSFKQFDPDSGALIDQELAHRLVQQCRDFLAFVSAMRGSSIKT